MLMQPEFPWMSPNGWKLLASGFAYTDMYPQEVVRLKQVAGSEKLM